MKNIIPTYTRVFSSICRPPVLFIAILVCGAARQSSPPGRVDVETPAPDETSTLNLRWIDRLEALAPSRPMDYFELAEELADEPGDEPQRALARRLFALAGALDPAQLGRSAALALADLEENDAGRRRLLALASLLGEDPSSNDSLSAPSVSPAAALRASEALSDYRRGRGPQALAILDDPAVAELLQRHGDLLPGGYNQFLQDCRIYRGDLRPSLNEGELARMLLLEEAILAGESRSWSSDLLVSGAAPLIEIDPTRVAEALDVDPRLNIYRDGRWLAAEE